MGRVGYACEGNPAYNVLMTLIHTYMIKDSEWAFMLVNTNEDDKGKGVEVVSRIEAPKHQNSLINMLMLTLRDVAEQKCVTFDNLIDEIKRHQGVSTQFCAQYLGVSVPTARLNLHRMAQQGILKNRRLSGQGGQRDVWYFIND